MAKDTLLKEAIADAKMVKEAAIANAMLTLKESFRPQISSMLATRLRNESDGAVEEQKKLDSSDIGGGAVTVNNPGPKKPSSSASSSSDIDNPDQEIETFGEGIEDFGAPDDEDGDEDSAFGGQAPAPAADPFGGAPEAGADVGLDGGDEFGGQDDGDLDLEAIIRELEADLMGGEGGDDAVGLDAPTTEAGAYTDAMAGRDPRGSFNEDAEGVHSSGKNLPSKDGFPGGMEVKPGTAVTESNDGDEDDEEVDLEEILREMEAEDSSAVAESEQIATENVELKRDLREHREVIKLLRTRINEVTLLNNKLMFTTKIFRNFSLNESQKKKVVEQFDRAGTLREAKLVYSTLVESLYGNSGSTTSKKVVAKITEGASKTIASTKPKSQILQEGDVTVARLQKLAGILHS